MDIKTKLNVGDKAYFMLQNKITQMLITQVQVFVFDDSIAISYMGKVTDDMDGNFTLKESIEERRLFRTKDDLVSSLKENVNKFYDDAKPEIHYAMTEEEKQLLLKDLCARLPYKVKVGDDLGRIYELHIGNAYLIDLFYENGDYVEPPIKPYLRPMSSMTEKEKEELIGCLRLGEYAKYFKVEEDGGIETSDINDLHYVYFGTNSTSRYTDWLNTHHFDYRGLIEKGLALKAPEGMYNLK